jgi:hypothetical protein
LLLLPGNFSAIARQSLGFPSFDAGNPACQPCVLVPEDIQSTEGGQTVSLQVILPCFATSLRNMRSSSSAHNFRAFSVFSPSIVPALNIKKDKSERVEKVKGRDDE